jgi:hypothetical protein
MPAKPSWFTRIPDILDELKQLDTPVIDRHICEILFAVRRRRAIELMQRFGGYRSGNTIVLDRADLIRSLERLHGSRDAAWERRRKHRLAERLDELHRLRSAATVTLPVSPAVSCPGADLPGEVIIGDGQLSVTFNTAEELFARLYELAQVAICDFEAFRRRYETAGDPFTRRTPRTGSLLERMTPSR